MAQQFMGQLKKMSSQLQPQPTRSVLAIIHHLVKQSHDDLKKCIQDINDQARESSAESSLVKKQILYQHFQETRERFCRLLILLRWSKKSKTTLDKINEVTLAMERKASSFSLVSDTLLNISRAIAGLREPVFDLPTAIDVLTTGTYPRLPHILQQVRFDSYCINMDFQYRGDLQNADEEFTAKDKEKALVKLTDLIRMKLLQCTIPSTMFVNKLENGQVNLIGENEFSIILTLNQKQEEPNMLALSGPEDVKYFWRIIYLQLLVNEEGVTVSPLYEELVFKLTSVLQKRLYYLDESDIGVPCMVDVYNIIRSVTLRLAMDILSKQARKLQDHRWGEIINCETFNEQVDRDISLSISYWHKAPPMVSFMEKYTKNGEDDEQPNMLKEKSARNEIRILIDMSKQIIFDFQPKLRNLTPPKLDFSRINLSKIITNCIFQHMVERLEIIRLFLKVERLFDEVEIVKSQETSQAEIHIGVFEDYKLVLSIDWKTGYFDLALNADGEKVDIDFSTLVMKLNNIDVRKTKFQDILKDVLEKARKRAIIHAYKAAGSLLDLEIFTTLFEGDIDLIDEVIYFAFPNIANTFIEVRANPYALKRGKLLVSCRIIIEKIPRLVDIKVPSSIFSDLYYSQNEEESDSYEPHHKKLRRMKSAIISQRSLIAFRHLKRMIYTMSTKVSFSLMLRVVQTTHHFSYDFTDQENEILLFPSETMAPKYFDLDYISLAIDSDASKWIATFYERKPLPVIIPPGNSVQKKYVDNRLTLEYNIAQSSSSIFEHMKQDLESIDKMYPLAMQLLEPNPIFSALLDSACEVEMVTHQKLRIDYGKSGYKAIITHSDDKFKVGLYPSTSRFEHDLGEFFNRHARNNEGDAMFKLVQLLLKSFVPQNKLQQILCNRHSTSWVLIPRTISHFKVICKFTDSNITREFMVECKPTGIIEIMEQNTKEPLHITSASYGEDLERAILTLKRYSSSSLLVDGILPTVRYGVKGVEVEQFKNGHGFNFSSSNYIYTFEFQNNELKLTTVKFQQPKTQPVSPALTENEEQFLKDAFTKCVLNVALDYGLQLTNLMSFFLMLSFPPTVFKHTIQAWNMLKDKIDLVFFHSYPCHTFTSKYDDFHEPFDIKVPKIFSGQVSQSTKLFDKQQPANGQPIANFIVRVYIREEYVDLPIQYAPNGEIKFLIGSVEGGKTIIQESANHEIPEEAAENNLFKLLSYVITNCSITQLSEMEKVN